MITSPQDNYLQMSGRQKCLPLIISEPLTSRAFTNNYIANAVESALAVSEPIKIRVLYQLPQNNISLGQRGHPSPHRHPGQVQYQGHLLRGGGVGGQIPRICKGPGRRGPRGHEPLR